MKATPRAGQDIFDITIGLFGRVDDLFDVVSTTLDVDAVLTPGAPLAIVTDSDGDTVTLARLNEIGILINNADDLAVVDVSGVVPGFVPVGYSSTPVVADDVIIPRAGQDIFDIAIKKYGRIDDLFTIIDTTLNIDSDLTPGASLVVNTTNTGDENVIRRLAQLNLYPNNADGFVIEPELIGVGYWVIENTFVVS